MLELLIRSILYLIYIVSSGLFIMFSTFSFKKEQYFRFGFYLSMAAFVLISFAEIIFKT
jgi:predicted membrane channel-forming protein YqfA (hemolysin III family)